MFCPACGLQINDDLKFCKQCGANLRGVRDAMTSNSTQGKSDGSKNWWEDIAHAHAIRELGIGVSPEEKRIKEIKGGVITSAVGIGMMIFLSSFFKVVTKGNDDQFRGDASKPVDDGNIPLSDRNQYYLQRSLRQPAAGQTQRTTVATRDASITGAGRASCKNDRSARRQRRPSRAQRDRRLHSSLDRACRRAHSPRK